MRETTPLPQPRPGAPALEAAFAEALRAARRLEGATSPNPPVGAALVDAEGGVLAACAHPGAGHAHAERLVLERARTEGSLSRARGMVVTLEPCNHHGRTPPCCDALAEARARTGGALAWISFGARDPNPAVTGGGEARLREAGFALVPAPRASERACGELIAPWAKWVTTGRPWVTLKRAWRELPDGGWTDVPPAGSNTFASAAALDWAHRLRRRADAVLTGAGTVLADRPDFRVRRVEDHPGRRRALVVLDRRGRVPEEEWQRLRTLGHEVRRGTGSLEEILTELGRAGGIVRVLVEAGATLSGALEAAGLWDESVIIRISNRGQEHREHVYRDR